MQSSTRPGLLFSQAKYTSSVDLKKSNSYADFPTEISRIERIYFSKAAADFLGEGNHGSVRGGSWNARFEKEVVVKAGVIFDKTCVMRYQNECDINCKVYGSEAAKLFFHIVGEEKTFSSSEIIDELEKDTDRKYEYRLLLKRHKSMTLREALKKHSNNIQKVLTLFIKAAEALDNLHTTYQLVHGDFTENNMMVEETADNEFILSPIDFGLTCTIDNSFSLTNLKVDVYALGRTSQFCPFITNWPPETLKLFEKMQAYDLSSRPNMKEVIVALKAQLIRLESTHPVADESLKPSLPKHTKPLTDISHTSTINFFNPQQKTAHYKFSEDPFEINKYWYL